MNKSIFSKLIVLVVAFMCMINGMLPAKTVFAENPDEGYEVLNCTKDGEYVLGELNAYSQTVIKNFGNNGITEIYYYDSNNEKVAPSNDGQGRVNLKAGTTYFYKGKVSSLIMHGKYGITTYVPWKGTLNLLHVDDATVLDQILTEGGGYSLSGSIAVTGDNKDQASLLEALISSALLLIGTIAYILVKFVVGGAFSIEKIIFNEYDQTRLTFFNNGTNQATIDSFINTSGLSSVLNDFYAFFNGIAIAAYLIILVYMAIRIMLGSTAEKGSRYKELIVYWLEGILILFLFPYVMKYSIQINDTFVKYIASGKEAFTSEIAMPIINPDEENNLKNIKEITDKTKAELQKGTDFMSIMYAQAWEQGWLVYTICWFVMFFQMIGFLVVYFKRILITMFLIAIFPLVMISYAIDKIGDAKSQAFGNWVKEFMLNVFMQSFHAIAYVLVMSTICLLMDNPSENWLLILIAITFISKGDDILRNIFSLTGKADTVKGIGRTVAETAAITGIAGTIRNVKAKFTGKDSAGRRLANQLSIRNQKRWDRRGNLARLEAAEIEKKNMGDIHTNNMPNISAMSNEDIASNIKNDLDVLFGEKSKSATEDDIRHAMDRLAEYEKNAKYNDKVKNALVNEKSNLSDEDKKALANLLKQNAATKAIMNGGRNININQNISIIISCLRKDSNGNLDKKSKAILNNIVDDESELSLLTLNVKFNKDKIKEKKKEEQRRKEQAENRNNVTKLKGRTSSSGRKEQTGAKSGIDYMMKTGRKEEQNRVSHKANLPGTERAAEEIAKRVNGNYNENSKAQDDRKNNHWENVESVNGNLGGTNSRNAAKKVSVHSSDSRGNTGNSLSNEQRYGKEETKTRSNFASNNQNIGEEIANQKGTVEDLKVFADGKYSENDEKIVNEGNEILNQILNEKYEKITKGSEVRAGEYKKDLEDAAKFVNILRVAETGKYTAEELLNAIDSLKEIINRNKNNTAKQELDDILNLLGVKLEDYEDFVRVKILNDPDSVENNKEIIRESKEYYLENKERMSKLIKGQLGYSEEDLNRDINMKYASRNYKGIVSSKVEKELKMHELERKINDLNKQKEKYEEEGYKKENIEIAKAAAETLVDFTTTTLSTGTGFMSVGMTTNGKGETLSEAVKGFYTGFKTANETFNTAKSTIQETSKDISNIGKDEFNSEGPIKEVKRKERKKK